MEVSSRSWLVAFSANDPLVPAGAVRLQALAGLPFIALAPGRRAPVRAQARRVRACAIELGLELNFGAVVSSLDELSGLPTARNHNPLVAELAAVARTLYDAASA